MNSYGIDQATLEELMESYPAKLVVMMYDQAIECLGEAVAAIAAGDIKKRFAMTSRVADILEVLHASLDTDAGGEIADNLGQIYVYAITQLPMINVRNDAELARGLIGILSPLRASWAELDERIRHDVAQAESRAHRFARIPLPPMTLPLAGAA